MPVSMLPCGQRHGRMSDPPISERFTSLKEFFPFYLKEHQDPTSRGGHFIGPALIALWVALALISHNAWWLVLIPISGYGFAWVGHAFFEGTRPATLQYPFYSLASDFILFWRLLTCRERFRP